MLRASPVAWPFGSRGPAAAAAAGLVGLVVVHAVWLITGWGGPRVLEVGGGLLLATEGLLASAAGAMFLFRREVPDRAAWAAVVVGILVWTFGQATWTTYVILDIENVPFPSLADVGYLGAYVPFLVAVALFMRKETRANLTAAGLDVVAGGAALFVAVDILVIHPLSDAGAPDKLALVLSVAYPLLDVVLATVALRLRVLGSAGGLPGLLLTGGLVAWTLADVAFAYGVAHGTYHTGWVSNVGWTAGFAGMGLAILASPHASRRLSPKTGNLGAVPFLVAAAAVVIEPQEARHPDTLLFAAIAVAALFVRVQLTLWENRRLLAAVEDRERHLAEAHRLARLGHLTVDLDHGDLDGPVDASAEARHLFGFGADDALTSGLFWSRVHPQDLPVVQAAAMAALESRQDITYRIMLPDGTIRWVRHITRVEARSDKATRRLLATVQDVTDQEVARTSAARIRALEEADRFRTTLFNTIAHELNTPLTPILIQTHLLKRVLGEHPDARQRHAVEVLDRNMQQLSHLTRDFLDVAQIQAGDLRIVRKPTDLGALVARAVDDHRAVVEEAHIRLDVEPERVVAFVDPVRITQVMRHLLGNALAFTPAGGRVRATVRREGDSCRVEVEDTGVGLTTEQQGLVFLPFGPVHAADAKRGLGLGLYLCKGIVELHGGTVDVKSPGPGLGSTFGFTLPLAMPTSRVPAGAAAPS